MARIMLIGESHSGKSSLIRALSDRDYEPRKTLAVTYFGPFVDTPGEFLENRRFLWTLLTSSAECQILLFVQDASRPSCRIPPGLARIFNRRVLGVAAKCDHPQARLERTRRFLKLAGAERVVETSALTGQGMDELRAELGLQRESQAQHPAHGPAREAGRGGLLLLAPGHERLSGPRCAAEGPAAALSGR